MISLLDLVEEMVQVTVDFTLLERVVLVVLALLKKIINSQYFYIYSELFNYETGYKQV